MDIKTAIKLAIKKETLYSKDIKRIETKIINYWTPSLFYKDFITNKEIRKIIKTTKKDLSMSRKDTLAMIAVIKMIGAEKNLPNIRKAAIQLEVKYS